MTFCLCSSDLSPTTYLLKQIPLVDDTHMDDRHGEFRPTTWTDISIPPYFQNPNAIYEFSVMGCWNLLSCFECRMKKKPRQIYRISLSLESTAQISVPFFFPSKQLKKVKAWLFKTSFTKKFAVLIYLWSYFDYAWYNDEIDLLGLKEQGFATDTENLYSYINLYKNISLIRLLFFLFNLLRDWVPPILEFLKGISATKCNLPSHVLKWAIFLTYTEDFWISSWGVGGPYMFLLLP